MPCLCCYIGLEISSLKQPTRNVLESGSVCFFCPFFPLIILPSSLSPSLLFSVSLSIQAQNIETCIPTHAKKSH